MSPYADKMLQNKDINFLSELKSDFVNSHKDPFVYFLRLSIY